MRIRKARLLLSAGFAVACIGAPASAAAANAATDVYPSGGSPFTSSPEGWASGGASCTPVSLLCTPQAVHETSGGNPGGAIAAKTTATLNLLDLFQGTVLWDSPKFTLPPGPVSSANVRLDRSFSPGGLVNVEPKATYVVTLQDLTSGTSTTPLSEQLTKDDTAFAVRSGAADVLGGHAYQLSISSTTAQSTLSLALLSGTAALRFDNVGLVVQTPSGGGGGGGQEGEPEGRLAKLLGPTLVNPALHRGKRLFVKVRCPAAIGDTCRITLQGLLAKRSPATRARNVRVGKGRTKRVVVKVKARARATLANRKRLLFKETLRAGGAQATVYKSLRLIRR
jgi:hypothetical protein